MAGDTSGQYIVTPCAMVMIIALNCLESKYDALTTALRMRCSVSVTVNAESGFEVYLVHLSEPQLAAACTWFSNQ